MGKDGGKTEPGGDYGYGGNDVDLSGESVGTGSGQPDTTPRTGPGGVGSSGSKSSSKSSA